MCDLLARMKESCLTQWRNFPPGGNTSRPICDSLAALKRRILALILLELSALANSATVADTFARKCAFMGRMKEMKIGPSLFRSGTELWNVFRFRTEYFPAQL